MEVSRHTLPFQLGTVKRESGPAPVVEVAGRHWLLSDVADDLLAPHREKGLMALFADWGTSMRRLEEIAGGLDSIAAPLAPGLEFLTPLQYPAKVVLTGTNYIDHVRNVGHARFNREQSFPAFFLKPPTTCLVGPGATVRYPEQSSKLDWEIELAVVIGKTARRVKASDALAHVAACTIGIDLSARDVQNNPRHYVGKDLCLGKAFDDSCPLGPLLIPVQFVGDLQDLSLKLTVNGVTEQDSNTRHMIWSVAEQIEEISKHMTLEPGDILMTGTPAGCGIEKGKFLHVGDVLRAEIQRLGALEVSIAPSGAT